MRQVLTTISELAGMIAVAYGVGMISTAGGVIVAGACLVLVGTVEGRKA